jgi:hypothetical protein
MYAGLVLGRIGGQMVAVALVLFVLARYHSHSSPESPRS